MKRKKPKKKIDATNEIKCAKHTRRLNLTSLDWLIVNWFSAWFFFFRYFPIFFFWTKIYPFRFYDEMFRGRVFCERRISISIFANLIAGKIVANWTWTADDFSIKSRQRPQHTYKQRDRVIVCVHVSVAVHLMRTRHSNTPTQTPLVKDSYRI